MSEPRSEPSTENDAGQSGPADHHLEVVAAEDELRNALIDGQLILYYQPIVWLGSFRIRGVEALLRWQHPIGGLLPPDDFLPGIPHDPLMREITAHVLNRACQELARWPKWDLSVNVAASDVVDPAFADVVVGALELSGLEPGRLTLELTEQSVVQDIAKASANLRVLREHGVGVALDDFGTGYSSLLYLRQLPITQVKIDRVFVSALERGGDDAAIVESVVRLAASIGLDVVAEGVETPAQASFLQSLGCPAAQGFLFAQPQHPDDMDDTAVPDWIGPSGPIPPPSGSRVPRAAADLNQVRGMLKGGASLHTIAAALNRSGATPPTGSRWTAGSAARLVAALPDINVG
jgi:EAL domain-containing protein (putative c-di-GMP-specific phosphodiesterase class I)